MNTITLDCPRCGTKHVAFTVEHEKRVKSSYRGEKMWDVFASCGGCGRGVVLTFRIHESDPSPCEYLGRPHAERGRKLIPKSIAPKQPSTNAPDHTPENVAEFFKQGADNIPGNWDAAGSMFRKTLEVALKEKFPMHKGTLHDRIRSLGDNHYLTPDLVNWADRIRRLGNDASHESEPFSEHEARQLFTFTRLVLMYIFTLPGMLATASGESDSGE